VGLVTSTRAASQWISRGTSGGSRDVLAADQPLGAGTVQMLASNATRAARENSLRTLWQDAGTDDVRCYLAFDAADGFTWDIAPADGGAVWYAGQHRVRQYGEQSAMPRIRLAARIAAPSTYTAGIVLVVRADPGRPSGADQTASASTTSTTMTSLTATIDLSPIITRSDDFRPRIGSATPPVGAAELGSEPTIHVWVGAYRTGGAGAWKAAVAGLSVYLLAP